MRKSGLLFLLALCLLVVTCSKDNPPGGGPISICPDHPDNCEGTCCDKNCVNTMADADNCGGCGNVCPQGTACLKGTCGCAPNGDPCQSGLACCVLDGCKDLSSDTDNCGACGNRCGTGATCSQGQCLCGGTTCGGTQTCCNGVCMDSCPSAPDLGVPTSGDCDCRGIPPDPFTGDQCPASGECVGQNCCLEDFFSLLCVPDGCTPSLTPQ